MFAIIIPYILEAFIPLLATLKFGISNILFNCITVDGIFTSINFIKTYAQKELSISEKLTLLQNKVSMLERYLYYTLLTASYWMLSTVFWFHGSHVIYSLLMLTVCPSVMSKVINYYYVDIIVKTISQELCRAMLYILSRSVSYMLNKMSIMSLKCDPNIDYHEIEAFFENFTDGVSEIINLIKSFFIVFVLYYVKKSNNSIYRYMLDTFYYFHGIVLTSDNLTVEQKKNKLAKILGDRRWDLLIRPKTINMFFEIYDNKNDDSLADKINMFFIKQFYYILKALTIWRVASIDVGLASLLTIYFYKEKSTTEYAVRILSVIILQCNYLIIGSLIAEFGYLLFRLMEEFHKYLKKKSFKMFYNNNKYNLLLFFVWISTLFFKEWSFIPYLAVIYNYDKIKLIIMISYYALAYLSHFNILHLIYLTVVIYLTINIMTYLRDDELRKNYLDMTYMSGYLVKYKMASSVVIKKERVLLKIRNDHFVN